MGRGLITDDNHGGRSKHIHIMIAKAATKARNGILHAGGFRATFKQHLAYI